ncbi:hypothetical protein TNCT_87301 [Trichonephila clavata]|uniref:Uncharacterized protein n=1 Tax=Trichonephila clavata TaxID=2740835 RepID=A0A8X6M1R6_TRICU|nr:hypothetical protein TNCT_87301 [Trichonephila clavata]
MGKERKLGGPANRREFPNFNANPTYRVSKEFRIEGAPFKKNHVFRTVSFPNVNFTDSERTRRDEDDDVRFSNIARYQKTQPSPGSSRCAGKMTELGRLEAVKVVIKFP